MVPSKLALSILLATVVAVGAACGGSSSSPAAPTATTPTATTPAGCSGAAIPQVEVGLNAGPDGANVSFQLFGETFNQQIAGGQSLTITRAVVPCSYELSGQML